MAHVAARLLQALRRSALLKDHRATPLRVADPRLRWSGPGAVPDEDLSALAKAGWSAQDLVRLTEKWPTARPAELTVLTYFAARLVSVHQVSPALVIAWTQAVFAPDETAIRLRKVVGDQIQQGRFPNTGALVEGYIASAGSATLALLNLAAGHTLDQVWNNPTAEQHMQMREAARRRGITLP